MSKLIDSLFMVNRFSPASLGFARAAAEKARAMLLVPSLKPSDLKSLAEIWEAKPAALILESASLDDETSKALPEGVPWGIVWSASKGPPDLPALKGMGCDFILLDSQTALASLLVEEEDIGKVLLMEPTIEDILWATPDLLPVDAIALSLDVEGKRPFNVRSLMRIVAMRASVEKPALLYIPDSFPPQEVNVLLEIGVEALVVPLRSPSSVEGFRAIQEAIKGLPGGKKRPRRKAVRAILPTAPDLSPKPRREEEEEEEEE